MKYAIDGRRVQVDLKGSSGRYRRCSGGRRGITST